MKRVISLLILSAGAFAQVPTPTPFSVMDAASTKVPTARFEPTDASKEASLVASRQEVFHQQVAIKFKQSNAQLNALYTNMLLMFAGDATLTAEQKAKAMTPAETLELNTLAWELYNILKSANPGAQIATPPVLPKQ